MADIRVETKLICNKEEVLSRARQAAALLNLRVHNERHDGFVAGNQWL